MHTNICLDALRKVTNSAVGEIHISQWVAHFAARYPISMMPPSRSKRFIGMLGQSGCFYSNARMSSAILFSVSMWRYGAGKAVSGMPGTDFCGATRW